MQFKIRFWLLENRDTRNWVSWVRAARKVTQSHREINLNNSKKHPTLRPQSSQSSHDRMPGPAETGTGDVLGTISRR